MLVNLLTNLKKKKKNSKHFPQNLLYFTKLTLRRRIWSFIDKLTFKMSFLK